MAVEEEGAQAVAGEEVAEGTILIMAVAEAADVAVAVAVDVEGEEEVEGVILVPIPLPGTPRHVTIQAKNGTHLPTTSNKG